MIEPPPSSSRPLVVVRGMLGEAKVLAALITAKALVGPARPSAIILLEIDDWIAALWGAKFAVGAGSELEGWYVA